jgi:hypothetical protein
MVMAWNCTSSLEMVTFILLHVAPPFNVLRTTPDKPAAMAVRYHPGDGGVDTHVRDVST